MVGHVELFGDDVPQEGRSPDPGSKTIGDRAAVHNVEDPLPLGRGQLGGTSAPVAFLESIQAVFIPGANPVVNTSEAEPQTVGQTSGLPVKGASGPVSRLQNLTCLQRIFKFKESSALDAQELCNRRGSLALQAQADGL
jgi:hypothetical protein